MFKRVVEEPSRSAYSRASDEFRHRGMSYPDEPEFEIPRLPYDLGDQADSELMILFNEFTIWTNFIAVQVTKAAVEEDDAEADLDVEEAKFIILNVEPGQVGIQRANKERRVDATVNVLRNRVLEKKALRKMTETLFNNMERSTFAVSRELSRRIGMAPAQGRMNKTGA